MRRDEGFVTVAVLGLAGVLLAVTGLIGTLAAVAVARHRVAATADLAALAGAAHVLDGTACAAAQRIARAQGGTLDSCSVDGDVVSVTVALRMGGLGTARARARAGPVGDHAAGNHQA